MAGTARKVTLTTLSGSDVRTLIEEHNKLIADVELIRGATPSASLLAAKIQNQRGQEITALVG